MRIPLLEASVIEQSDPTVELGAESLEQASATRSGDVQRCGEARGAILHGDQHLAQPQRQLILKVTDLLRTTAKGQICFANCVGNSVPRGSSLRGRARRRRGTDWLCPTFVQEVCEVSDVLGCR